MMSLLALHRLWVAKKGWKAGFAGISRDKNDFKGEQNMSFESTSPVQYSAGLVIHVKAQDMLNIRFKPQNSPQVTTSTLLTIKVQILSQHLPAKIPSLACYSGDILRIERPGTS